MSEVSTTRFLNRDGEVNSLVLDPSNNTALIKDDSGDIIVNYTNGTWAPTNKAPVDILKDSKKGGIFDRAFKSSYDNLSEVDQNKLSIYASEKNIENETVAQSDETTITDGQDENQSMDVGKQQTYDEKNVFKNLRYPESQKETDNFDYLKISCYDYEPGLTLDNIEGSGFKIPDIDDRPKTKKGVITLPIQPGISESNSVGWGEDSLNPLQVAGANIAGGAIDFLTREGSGEKFMNLLKASTKGALDNVDEALIKQYFAGQAVSANLLGRTTGQTVNNNVEVLFNGPQLRTFTYSYRFTPREPKEAQTIKEIIRFFKKQMAPKRSNSRIFLKSPNVWKLKYTFRNGDFHPFLNNIKMCALSNFNVDYTPDGSYSTYDDEGGRGDGSMTSYQVGLSFKEITPIYHDDFWTDDEGKQGTGF